MELLVLGIDGGDADIISAMDMPITQQLLTDRVDVQIREDLWGRGWSEVISGMESMTTGAYYEKPKLDGTYGFTQSYRVGNYDEVPECIPLWNAIANRGRSIGFLNLPTTLPAPQVDGFFVSGAGSGFSPASRIPISACQPPDMYMDLLERYPIWEQRFRVSGITSVDYFIDRCARAVTERVAAFVDMCQSHEPDVGFVVQKESVILSNLFMKTIQEVIDRGGVVRTKVQRRIAEFFRIMDDATNVLLNRLQPKHVMVVSDHAARPYRRSMNLNQFLLDADFLKPVQHSDERHPVRRMASSAKQSLRSSISKVTSPREEDSVAGWANRINFDAASSLAFTNRYIPGIYLNDQRFGGAVNDHDAPAIVREIVESLNSSDCAKSEGLRAMPYRALHDGAAKQDLLPDVWVDLPEDMFPEGVGQFVQPNPYWDAELDFSEFPRDIITGMKGRNALCSVESRFADDTDNSDSPPTLTRAYDLILRHLES